jgi:hydrogenase maturation protein HypF
MKKTRGAKIHITGIVQGVGFRPFVYGLATRLELTGWVRNTSSGVDIEVNGDPKALDQFIQKLKLEAPPLSRIDDFKITSVKPDGFATFEIQNSEAIPGAFQPISPDVSICPDCLRELFDPKDRRYQYPFINCTNCGPRFTIIEDIPYDRLNTTMAAFKLCPECQAEYEDPADRRFHAQPVACPACGPKIWVEKKQLVPSTFQSIEHGKRFVKTTNSDQAIQEVQSLLKAGRIVAIKGLGGFHLACDATNHDAVIELRRRKLRVDRPFALMMPDLETVEAHCEVTDTERILLESSKRPIVILKRRPSSPIVREVAPSQNSVGVMLPYTPLHYLLLHQPGQENRNSSRHEEAAVLPEIPRILVMTSGNLSEEPIATDNEEARKRLADLADAFLIHDRPIRTRCDDSVTRIIPNMGQKYTASGLEYLIRRSRGYAPDPVLLPWESAPLLATGGELKNTFCLTRDRYAFLSQHIGDLENYETLQAFEDGIAHFERLFHIHPQALAYDAHPNYLSTRYALDRSEREGVPAFRVQHHHAHIAACMAEHGMPEHSRVIGVAFDGTGYGDDGAIWGGEFLLAGYSGFQRYAHLDYAPLPGGDAAIRKPARTALAYLWKSGQEWESGLPCVSALCVEERAALRMQLEHNINTPLTSSMGRLFDAVAALTGIRQKINYEAQAAIEFEAVADTGEQGAYSFLLSSKQANPAESLDLPLLISWERLMEELLADVYRRTPVQIIAARFHNGVARMVLEVCRSGRKHTSLNEVVLSGGVWQNITLLTKTVNLLVGEGFQVFIHRQVPANDGGLALGQAAIASRLMA